MPFQKGHPPYNKKGAAVAEATVDIASELAAMRAELNSLRAENDSLRAKQPQFVKMRNPDISRRERTYVPPEQLRAQAMKKLGKGGETGGQTKWWDTPQGRSTLPPEYRPVFGPGDLVRVNPDAPIFGGPVALKDSKNTIIGHAEKWGQLLEHLGIEGAGELVGTMGLTDSFEPKYKCTIRGLTTGFGGGFRESELLPYEG